MGFGKKRAIICAVCKTDKVDNNNSLKSYKNKSVNIEDVSSRLENSNKDSIEKDCKTTLETKEVSCNVPKVESKEKIFDKFYHEEKSNDISKIIIKKSKDEIISEIKSGLNLLFDNSCFRLEDRNTRNDICILINYVVSSPESHPYFIYSDHDSNSNNKSFLDILLFYATHDERISIQKEVDFEGTKELPDAAIQNKIANETKKTYEEKSIICSR